MEETIGADVENQPAFTLAPFCVRYRTAVVVPLGRRSFDSECAEAATPQDWLRSVLEADNIQGFSPDKLVRPAKR